MSGIGPRNMGHGLTVALTRFVDTTIAPPSSPDPVLYRKGLQFFLRDTVGIEHPVAVGADGLGVVEITFADSPYDVQETDRVLAVDSRDGDIVVTLPADGGPFTGRPLYYADAARSFSAHSLTFQGNGNNINGAASLVVGADGASGLVLWTGSEWSIVAGNGSSAAPAAHAASHRAGGSDALLAAPGVIGGTTPAAVNTSSLYLTGSTPAADPAKVQLLQTATLTGVQIVGGSGQRRTLEVDNASGTALVANRAYPQTIANNGTHDVAISSKGGRIQVTGVGATGSTYATASFANNGATSFNGATYTGYSTTLGTPASINIAASGGNVRIENLSGSSVNFLIVVDQLLAV